MEVSRELSKHSWKVITPHQSIGRSIGGMSSTLQSFNSFLRQRIRLILPISFLPSSGLFASMISSSLCHFVALTFPPCPISLTMHFVWSRLHGCRELVSPRSNPHWSSIATHKSQGKRSLTRDEFEIVEKSSVLFQEVVALLLGSESIKHVDFSDVLARTAVPSTPTSAVSGPSASLGCEIVPPIILLLRSLQSRCKSIILSGNRLDQIDVTEICKCSCS